MFVNFPTVANNYIMFERHEVFWDEITKKFKYISSGEEYWFKDEHEINFINNACELKKKIELLQKVWSFNKNEFFNFFPIKLGMDDQKVDWFLAKIFSSSNMFSNSMNSLSFLINLCITEIYKRSFSDVHACYFKNNLFLNVFTLLQSTIISLNSSYIVNNSKKNNLSKYDQNIDFIEIKINGKSEIPINNFIHKDLHITFIYNDFKKIRNIITHPYSYREKENQKIVYYLIGYISNSDCTINMSEIFLCQLTGTFKKGDQTESNWMEDSPRVFIYEKIDIFKSCLNCLDIVLALLS